MRRTCPRQGTTQGRCACWRSARSARRRLRCLVKNEKPDGSGGNLEKGGMFRLFPRLTPDEAGFRGKYGFIRFLQEILLDFNAAGEVYYNRFRMEQRAACRGAILHLFKFT